MKIQQWIAQGVELFGADWIRWQFICPQCGNVQTMQDAQQMGLDPEHAATLCLSCWHPSEIGTVKVLFPFGPQNVNMSSHENDRNDRNDKHDGKTPVFDGET
jgi:hypothetical protein